MNKGYLGIEGKQYLGFEDKHLFWDWQQTNMEYLAIESKVVHEIIAHEQKCV